MTSLFNKRRNFLKNFGISLSYFFLSNLIFRKRLKANNKPRVVIIGFGIGGATCLKYLKNFSDEINITIVESKKKIRTCPFSNLVIGNFIVLVG